LRGIETVKELALKCNDLSTAGRMEELKGKYLAMFTDKKIVDAHIITQEDQSIIDKYISNRVSSLTPGLSQGLIPDNLNTSN